MPIHTVNGTVNGLLRAISNPALDPISDGELLGRYANYGDEEAFRSLMHRHAGMVLGACRRVLGNATDADDAFQATFVVLVRKARTLIDRPCLGAFLYGVAYHTALKLRAMTVKRRFKEVRTGRPESHPDRSEVLAALDEELARLPEKYREPVVLCELEGRTRQEAAQALGVPQGTLSSRLATAHRTLERRLRSRGFAGVCVAVVLSGHVSAGTDALADAALMAVLGPTRGVAQLATEATKMLLLHKIGLGGIVLTGLMMGIVTALPGQPDEGPRAGSNVRAPIPRAEEPEWMKAFHAAYQLKEGEYAKRVPAPFVPERRDFVRVQFPRADAKSLDGLLTMGVMFAEADGKTVSYRAMVTTDAIDFDQPTKQVRNKRLPLRSVIAYSTGRLPPEVVFDDRANDREVFMEGDFVVRKNAPLEKLLPDLQKAIGLCEMDTPKTHPTLSLKEEVQDVYVVSGPFKITPRKWRKAGEIDVYADEMVLNKEFTVENAQPTADVNTSLYMGQPIQFVRELGSFVNQRLVWESEDSGAGSFRAYTHFREGTEATAEQQRADRDSEKVLKNVSEQTGLTFKKEKRKVQVLYVVTPRP